MITIPFRDYESHDEGVAVIRQVPENHVAFALSLRRNGDMEVVLDTRTARLLAEAILKLAQGDATT